MKNSLRYSTADLSWQEKDSVNLKICQLTSSLRNSKTSFNKDKTMMLNKEIEDVKNSIHQPD